MVNSIKPAIIVIYWPLGAAVTSCEHNTDIIYLLSSYGEPADTEWHFIWGHVYGLVNVTPISNLF